MVPAQLQDALSVLERVLLLLVGLDVFREAVREGQEEVGEVATAALVEFLLGQHPQVLMAQESSSPPCREPFRTTWM